MEIDLSNGGNLPARLLLGIFTLVGFLASVVTITQYFGSSESSLSVTVQQHKFRTPYYSGRALQSNQPSRVLSDDLRKTLCENFSDDQILNIEFAEIPNTFGAKKAGAENCKKAQAIEFASRWLGEFSSSDTALYEYDIKNDGEKPADGIRIRSTGLNTAQYSADDEEFVELVRRQNIWH